MKSTFEHTLRKIGGHFPLVASHAKSIRTLLNRRGRIGNIAVFHPGRCGSTVLGNMLHQHSDIIWAREIFTILRREHPHLMPIKSEVKGILNERMHRRRTKFFGFETKYSSEWGLRSKWIDMPIADYVNLLRDLRFSYFIILQRRNHLRRLISGEVGLQRKAWHSSRQVDAPTKVTLNLNRGNGLPLLEYFRCLDDAYTHLRSLLAKDNVLELVYEDDILADPLLAYKKVCRFIGVEERSPKVSLTRTNPFAVEEIIVNFEEVQSLLKGTKHEWMLHS